MSRLYLLLDAWAGKTGMDDAGLSSLLHSVVASHADCGATGARLALGFELLCRRGALVTPGLAGWKAYPAGIDAIWRAWLRMLAVLPACMGLFARATTSTSWRAACKAMLANRGQRYNNFLLVII